MSTPHNHPDTGVQIEPPSEAMLNRLLTERQRGPLSWAVLTYWADRFEEHRIMQRAACPFHRYLKRPVYYEKIASRRMALRAQHS